MSSLSEQECGDTPLARFLSFKDRYASHLKPFLHFLQENQLDLDLAAVKAYFVHVNALPLAAGTKLIRRQAVKARLRATLSSTDFNQQARLESMLRSLDHGSETRAPAMVRTGIGEDRVISRGEFDRLVAGTSRRRPGRHGTTAGDGQGQQGAESGHREGALRCRPRHVSG